MDPFQLDLKQMVEKEKFEKTKKLKYKNYLKEGRKLTQNQSNNLAKFSINNINDKKGLSQFDSTLLKYYRQHQEQLQQKLQMQQLEQQSMYQPEIQQQNSQYIPQQGNNIDSNGIILPRSRRTQSNTIHNKQTQKRNTSQNRPKGVSIQQLREQLQKNNDELYDNDSKSDRSLSNNSSARKDNQIKIDKEFFQQNQCQEIQEEEEQEQEQEQQEDSRLQLNLQQQQQNKRRSNSHCLQRINQLQKQKQQQTQIQQQLQNQYLQQQSQLKVDVLASQSQLQQQQKADVSQQIRKSNDLTDKQKIILQAQNEIIRQQKLKQNDMNLLQINQKFNTNNINNQNQLGQKKQQNESIRARNNTFNAGVPFTNNNVLDIENIDYNPQEQKVVQKSSFKRYVQINQQQSHRRNSSLNNNTNNTTKNNNYLQMR